MDDFETNVNTGAESPEVTESHEDDDFLKGFEDDFGFETEEEEPEETEETEPETEEKEAAESGAEQADDPPKMISFREAGREFSAPKEAVEAFAKAVGRDSASLIDIYQKGCNYDKLNERLSEAMKDSEAFEKMAAVRGMDKTALREDLLAQLEHAKLSGAVEKIKNENPGISEETARELAKFRLEQQKPKAEEPKAEKDNSEENEARLREVEMFQAKHPELPALPNEVIELWKKSGVSLESAYEAFRNKTRVAELEKEIAEMKTQKKKDDQKAYAKEHSPGSASSNTGHKIMDDFIEGLFAEY